jgi:hypothetical protein
MLTVWIRKPIPVAAPLRRGSAAACLLGLWVRILSGHGCLSVVGVVFCQVEVSAWGWSQVRSSYTECSCVWVCLSVIVNPQQWGRMLRHGETNKDKESVMKMMEAGKSTRIKWVEYICVRYGTRIRAVGDVYTGTRLHTSLGNRIVEVMSRLRAGRSGVRIQNVQTGSEAHSVFYSMGTEWSKPLIAAVMNG